MKKIIKSSRIVTPDEVIDGYIVFDNRKIEYIGSEKPDVAAELMDFGDNIVTAGFIEMHIHGVNGSDFLNSTVKEMKDGIDFLCAHGVTTICPTVTSAPIENMKKGLLAI